MLEPNLSGSLAKTKMRNKDLFPFFLSGSDHHQLFTEMHCHAYELKLLGKYLNDLLRSF